MPFYLETTRLKLRPLQTHDIPLFSAYRSDPEVARYQSWDTPFTIAQATEFITGEDQREPSLDGGWYQLGIESKESGLLIGDCVFHALPEDRRQTEIGFTLARQSQRKGFALEAVSRLLHYLFDELNAYRVTAICDAENEASANLLRKLGMRQEAHYIDNVWFKGKWGSEYAFALLQREWQAARETRTS